VIRFNTYIKAITLMGQIAVDFGLAHPIQKRLLNLVGLAESKDLALKAGDLVIKARVASMSACRIHFAALQEKDLVETVVNQEDQRSRLVRLTVKGASYFKEMNSAILGAR